MGSRNSGMDCETAVTSPIGIRQSAWKRKNTASPSASERPTTSGCQ